MPGEHARVAVGLQLLPDPVAMRDGPAKQTELVLHLVSPLVRENRRGREVPTIGDRPDEEVGAEVDRAVDVAVGGAIACGDPTAGERRRVVPDDIARAEVDAAETAEGGRPVVAEPFGGRLLHVTRAVRPDRIYGRGIPGRDRERDGHSDEARAKPHRPTVYGARAAA